MRTDGQVIFWQVQQLVEDQWSCAHLPFTKRFHKLWIEHTVNGMCRQLWGLFGFLNPIDAMDGIDYAHKILPRAHLRLVRIELSKKTDEVVEIQPSLAFRK